MRICTLIIIPARMGSKGIPDKNIKVLGDKPLFVWTARAIENVSFGSCVTVLSTDSERYAAIGREFGVWVPFIRPADCSDDMASAMAVIDHALQWFKEKYSYFPDQVMWLQPTSPFRSPYVIEKALTMMVQQQADGVIGCKEIHRDLATLFRTRDGFLTPLSEGQTQIRRQDVEPLLTPNGAMYLCKTSVLHHEHSFYGERTLPLVMNAIQSLDIDTEEDWAIAEAFIKQGLV